VGRLGTFRFQGGTYIYIGSALNNIEKRVARHTSKTKTLKWHIDFLLLFAKVRDVVKIKTEKKIECTLNRVVSETVPVAAEVKGFGSSDCRCVTHLWRGIVPPSQDYGGWFFDPDEFLTLVKEKM
jgi:Uri superfamily endonuclease